MVSVINPQPDFALFRGPNFVVEGDLRAAYEALREKFVLSTEAERKSGPIKPLSAQEKLADQNPALVQTLNDLPPSNFS